jgi:FAD/FMN-containing dehydrogenase
MSRYLHRHGNGRSTAPTEHWQSSRNADCTPRRCAKLLCYATLAVVMAVVATVYVAIPSKISKLRLAKAVSGAARHTLFDYLFHSPPVDTTSTGYVARVKAAVTTLQEARRDAEGKQQIALKDFAHSHVWLGATGSKGIDLSNFVHTLHVNREERTVDVEGRAQLLDILMELSRHGMTLEVIPDMKHLTVGGLYAGVGGGAASFLHGAFHHSVVEVDLLTSAGKLVKCSAAHHPNLFAMLPSSLGTLGYALRLRLRIKPAKRYVRATHTKLNSTGQLVVALTTRMRGDAPQPPDFMDATVFSSSPGDYVLIEGFMEDSLPTGVRPYSLGEAGEIYALKARAGGELWFELIDFIYRWDPDGYYSTWEGPAWMRDARLRRLLFLLFGWMHRSDWLREFFGTLYSWEIKAGNNMVADYCVPLVDAARHLQWFEREIGVFPIYLAPVGIGAHGAEVDYTMWNLPLPALDIGIGYGPNGRYAKMKSKCVRKELHSGVSRAVAHLSAKCNAGFRAARDKMENYVASISAMRLQYSRVDRGGDTPEFWRLFPPGAREAYMDAKQRWDPANVFPTVVDKLTIKKPAT